MSIYTIRPGFTINIDGTSYQGGQEVDLNLEQLGQHKHKLEGIEADVIPTAPNNSDCVCFPAPFVSIVSSPKILTASEQEISIFGSYFTPNTTVELEAGTVLSVEFVSSSLLKANITAGNTPGFYDLIINNGSQTVEEDFIQFFDTPEGLVDLRSSGTSFSPAAIEMRSGMSFTRTAEGMYFSGSNPWSSWARFVGDDDRWVWSRSQKKSLSWISVNSDTIMQGIGSRQNDETNNTQYLQAERVAYLTRNNLSSLFGNTGNPGSGTSQGLSIVKSPTDIIKTTLTNNGEVGGKYRAYRLPGAAIPDWFDTSDLLGEVDLNDFGADAPEIMPFVIPRSGTTSIFLGFILEDE